MGKWCLHASKFIINLQVTRTGIRSQMSSNSGLIRAVTLELFALDCWKRPFYLLWSYLPWLLKKTIFDLLELEDLWGQLANIDQILYEASLGWGKGCIRFWDKLDRNSGFHGNRKRPLTYNGENDVSTFSLLFFISPFSNLQVMRICIKSQMSSNFVQIGSLPTELCATERLKNFP